MGISAVCVNVSMAISLTAYDIGEHQVKHDLEAEEKRKAAQTTFKYACAKFKAALPSTKKAAKAKAASAASPLAGKKFPLAYPEGGVTQENAKQYIPPGCYIWKSSAGAWCGHYPNKGYPRVSCSWVSGHSFDSACQEVTRKLWRQFNEFNGRSETDCPIAGLF